MAQLTPIKGFTNVPVTKSIVILTTILPLLLGILDLKYLVHFNLKYTLDYNQYWRLLSFQTSVVNESDYLLVVTLFWYYKSLERFYGNEKYLTLLVVLFAYNSIISSILILFSQVIMENAVLLLNKFGVFLPVWDFNFASGPLGLLSSFYICYKSFIPVNYLFEIELRGKKVSFTNHFPLQIIYLLLFLNNGIKSIVPMTLGLIYGKLLIHNLLPKPKRLIPSFFYTLFVQPSKVFDYFSRSSPSSYQPLNQPENPIIIVEPENDEDDDEEDPRSQIRAETPVRPLTGQFIDTFRNNRT